MAKRASKKKRSTRRKALPRKRSSRKSAAPRTFVPPPPPTPTQLVARGWDSIALWQPEDAQEYFSEAVRQDPGLADGHNGLGELHLIHGDADAAERCFRKALELNPAPPTAPGDSWKDLRIRPTLRAREGLARVLWRRGEYEQAARVYRELLDLNPEDSQQNRWVIGSLLQHAGRNDEALEYYRWFEKSYPFDPAEPHMLMNWGLALAGAGDLPAAVRKWWGAAFYNPYIIPHLLGQEPKPHPIEHTVQTSELDYADGYSAEFTELWEHAPKVWTWLARFWEDDHVRDRLQEWVEHGRKLASRSDPRDRIPLHKRQMEIAVEGGDPALHSRIQEGWGRGSLVDTLLDGIVGLRLRIVSVIRRLDRDGVDPDELPRPVVEGQSHADTILSSLFNGLLTTEPGPQDLDETAYVVNMLDPMIKHFQQVMYKNLPGTRKS